MTSQGGRLDWPCRLLWVGRCSSAVAPSAGASDPGVCWRGAGTSVRPVGVRWNSGKYTRFICLRMFLWTQWRWLGSVLGS